MTYSARVCVVCVSEVCVCVCEREREREVVCVCVCVVCACVCAADERIHRHLQNTSIIQVHTNFCTIVFVCSFFGVIFLNFFYIFFSYVVCRLHTRALLDKHAQCFCVSQCA